MAYQIKIRDKGIVKTRTVVETDSLASAKQLMSIYALEHLRNTKAKKRIEAIFIVKDNSNEIIYQI